VTVDVPGSGELSPSPGQPRALVNLYPGQGWSASTLPAFTVPGESDGLRLFNAARKRWLIVLCLGALVSLILAAAAWFLLAPQATAFAHVFVAASPPRILGPSSDAASRNDFLVYQKLQANRMKSRFVLNAALKRDDVKSLHLTERDADPVAWLEDEIKVDFKEGSETFTVSMTGRSPRELITLVDAVTQCYVHEVLSTENQNRADEIAELENIFSATRDKLLDRRNTRRRLVEQLGSSDSQALTQKQVVLVTNFGEVKKQHINVRFELMKAQGRLMSLENRLKSQTPASINPAEIDKAVESDPTTHELRLRLSKLQDIVHDYELNAVRSDEPSLLLARKKLASVNADLDDRRAQVAAQVQRSQQTASHPGADPALGQLTDEVAILTAQEKSLRTDVEKLTDELGKIGNTSTEVAMLSDEIKQEEKLCERVGERLETLKFELRAPPRVRIDQPAGLAKLERKKQLLGTICAPLAAFIGVGLSISWWETRARRLQTVHEVAQLGMRLVGSVPRLPGVPQPPLVASHDDHRIYGPTFLESMDAIRTPLLRDAALDGTRGIMVTSAVEGEAKTTLASHLAGSLARGGRKTLLIDCDLRRPTLQRMFDVPLQPGFSEALLGEIDLEEAIRETESGLFVLAAGQWDREVLRVLAKDGLKNLLEPLRARFDFIVIDSHPVLAAADSLLIGQYVDAVLISLLRDRSQLHVVYAACERLAGLGIRVLGAVVNGVDPHGMYQEFGRSSPPYQRT